MVRNLLVCLVVVLSAAGCTKSRDVEKDLALLDVRSGWYDAGILQTGENKLVPTVSLKLQNISQDDISNVQLMAIFRREGEEAAWGDHFVRAIDSDGLAPGALGDNFVLRSQRGYTSTDARLRMLENSSFVDVKVEIFGKHGSRTWAKMGEYPIDRQLLTE